MSYTPTRRSVLLTAAATPLLAACHTIPSTGWTLPAPQPYRVIEHTWIPMRDGKRLSARIWLPETLAGSPAVLECIPYRKRDLYRAYDDIWGATLGAAGIAFVRVDVRGSGDSEGVITDEYSETELEDCVETIAWIARQDWCSGAVGMRGLSWGGINTLQVAARRPPALKAIVPMGCCDTRYTDDAHYIGGSLAHANFQWGVLFKVVMAGPPDPAIVGDAWRDMWKQRLDATPPILATWTQHQRDDAYWRRGSVSNSYADINVPALLASGWSDTYCEPVLRLLASLTSPTKAIIGPWGHTYPNLARPIGLAWAREEVRWWRQWLMSDSTGIMDEPDLRAFMPYATVAETGANPIPGRWIAERRWPATPAMQRFHLNLRTLDSKPAPATQLTHHDIAIVGATKPEWLDLPSIDQSADDRLCLTFDTAPLDAPLEVLGTAKAHLRLTSDTPITQIVLRLCEVKPDGTSWLVTWAALNLTRRESMSAPTPLTPGQIYDIPISLRAVAHRFNPGSRIRVAISTSLWPVLWPTPAQPTLTLHTGVSTLDLPTRAIEAEPLALEDLRREGAPPPPYAPPTADASGRLVHTTSSPRVPFRIESADIELGPDSDAYNGITTAGGAPEWRERKRSTWRRDDWDCAVEASYRLTSDGASFTLEESLRATERGAEVFARTSTTIIPRDLL